jgi:putative ABC transport system permease protein
MNTLDRKILRDLWRMKGQAFAIILVITCGMATFVMFISAMDSLQLTRRLFYSDYNFAEAFVSLKRAPESLKERIQEIPGVRQVETRVAADVKLDISGFPEPVTAKILSMPDDGNPLMNKLYIRKGRLADPAKDNEVVVNENFALEHGFKPGDTFGAVINGRWKTLIITGVALSPEFVLIMRPGAVSPDFKHYGILWMGRKALGTAYNMDGAFNDVVLSLYPDAKIGDVITQLDDLLERYGGFGAYGRDDQLSHRMLSQEFRMLRKSAQIYPTIFMCVAAFLLNVVISRTVNTQREQIASLKAFGYGNVDVAVHYAKLVIMIVVAGTISGSVAGIWLGKYMGNMYMEFYRFPYLNFRVNPAIVGAGMIIIIVASLLGTLHSVWRAARQSPAEAMRPEPPAQYRVTLIERTGIGRWLSQPSRIIARNVARKPVRSILSIVGIAIACATMITGGFFKDSVDYMLKVQFKLSQKEDMTITFIEPTSRKAVYDVQGMEGVNHAEPFRMVPARFRFGHHSYKTVIEGVEPESSLHYIMDKNLRPVSLPPSGIVINEYLGRILGIGPGDMLTVEILEGERPVRQVPVVATVSNYLGVTGYMNLTALNRLMREGNAISGVYIATDSLYQEKLYQQFMKMPRVAGTTVRKDDIRNFYEVQAKGMLFFTFVATIMAGSIIFGVVYNSARIALSERSRELSSLRVLGYTRGEISYILLGELGLLTIAAIPVGFLIGQELCGMIARALESELFRIPTVLEARTFSMAAAVVLSSAALSGLIVRRKLDHLDLVEVLKSRE